MFEQLSDAQLTGLVVAFGVSIGTPIANALRAPRIDKAIEKGAVPLVAKDEDQQREIAALKAQLLLMAQQAAHQAQQISFLQQAILGWRQRAPEPPPLEQPPVSPLDVPVPVP